MNEQDEVRLRHMLDAAQEAVRFAEGYEKADLAENRMLALALIKSIETVGEAAGRVSKDIQVAQSQIPWADIIAMRNRLIHGYFDINLDIVWDTVVANFPPLVTELQVLLSTDGSTDMSV